MIYTYVTFQQLNRALPVMTDLLSVYIWPQ